MAFDMSTAKPVQKKGFDISSAKPEDGQPTGFFGGLIAGAERGVKQTLGGATQKLAQARKSQLDSAIEDMVAKIQSGEIPATEENLARLDQLQSQGVQIARDLAGYEGMEASQRQDYSSVQKEAPISSFIGNVAGQMAALPIPGLAQAKLKSG